MNELLIVLTGLVASALTGGVKTLTDSVDRRLTGIIKPFAPILVTVAAAALPKLASAIGLADLPDAQALTQAPAAAVVGIVARELAVRIQRARTARRSPIGP